MPQRTFFPSYFRTQSLLLTLSYFLTQSLFLTLILSFFSLACSAQNLLDDPSFENSDYGLTKTWKNFTGSVDLYDVRALKKTDGTHVKPQFEKTGLARTGNFFTGKAFGWLGLYTEILICPLTQPLVAGQKYSVKLWVRQPPNTLYQGTPIPSIPIAFWVQTSARDLASRQNYPYLELKSTAFPILYSREWTQVEGIYLAKGGEKYLEIGSNPQKHTSEIEVPYYYMDDVMIVPIEVGTQSPILTTVNCSNLVTDPSFEKAFIKKNNTYTLENILFETNKSILLPSSFVSLDSLVALLKREKLKHIELHGHTDNEGNDAQNQRLSEARAQAVANYLRSKGIDNQRVRSKGFGATRPVETNDTPEGRLKNRRVEFVLYFP